MIIYNKSWMKSLKPLSFCPKIDILILDLLYSIYILLYLFNKKFHWDQNSRNSRFLGNPMFEKSSKFLKIPDF